MSSRAFLSALLGCTCLAALPAFADTPAATFTPSHPHSFTELFQDRAMAGMIGSYSAPPVTQSGTIAAGNQAASSTVAGAQSQTAGDIATDVVAATTICDGYFAASRDMSDALTPAFTAMAAHDTATLSRLLPGLQVQLNALPASEIRAEVCTGNHINAYSAHQYAELNTLRSHNVPAGMPADLPIVKQPDLNHSALAYAVGWTYYEVGDFNSALAAYGKGLAMFPFNHTLQSEYMATLLQLHQGAQAEAFAGSVLMNTYDLDDGERAKMYVGRGVGEVLQGQVDNAIESLTIAQRYSQTQDTQSMLDQLNALKAQTPAKQ